MCVCLRVCVHRQSSYVSGVGLALCGCSGCCVVLFEAAFPVYAGSQPGSQAGLAHPPQFLKAPLCSCFFVRRVRAAFAREGVSTTCVYKMILQVPCSGYVAAERLCMSRYDGGMAASLSNKKTRCQQAGLRFQQPRSHSLSPEYQSDCRDTAALVCCGKRRRNYNFFRLKNTQICQKQPDCFFWRFIRNTARTDADSTGNKKNYYDTG